MLTFLKNVNKTGEIMRILIAEDEPKLLKALMHILKINNYDYTNLALLKVTG